MMSVAEAEHMMMNMTEEELEFYRMYEAEAEEAIESGGYTNHPDTAEAEETDACEQQQNPLPEIHVGKPQVWVRIRTTPCCNFDNNIFEIPEDNKTLNLIIKPEDRLFQKKTGKTTSFKFSTDGIMQNKTQEETYALTVQEVVQKAMDGISGVVVCVGPDNSGKSYTMFGPQTSYQLRGILPRALEKAFEIVDAKKSDMEYHLIFSMFEIRKDKIKDLLTLAPWELRRVGDFGPMGLFMEEITSIEQALSLMLRAVIGQKQIPRESYSKCHTIAYLDILAQDISENSEKTQKKWRSRITFAKIASMPKRDSPLSVKPSSTSKQQLSECMCVSSGGCFLHSKKKEDESANAVGKCCRGATGELAESISIRKDLSFLEQMFIRAHNLRKINDYYAKLQSMGMYMLMKPPKLAPSQYFRQSKLAHCLKDIVSGRTIIRLILQVRPERSYVQSALEVMRFAERARCIPYDIPRKSETKKCQLFEEKISQMCQELGIPDPVTNTGGAGSNGNGGKKGSIDLPNLYGQISPDKMKEILQQASAYFEEKLDSLEGACKDQVKGMFEAFREMWNHMLTKEASHEEEAEGSEKSQQDLLEIPVVEETAIQTEDVHEHNMEHRKSISKRGKGGRENKDSKGRSKDRDKKKKYGRTSISRQQVKNKNRLSTESKHGSDHEEKLLRSSQNKNTSGSDGATLGLDEEEMEGSDEVTKVNRSSGSSGGSKEKPAETAPPPSSPDDKLQKPTVAPTSINLTLNETGSVHRANTSISIAVTPTSKPDTNANAVSNAGPPVLNKHEAWNGFVKSELGIMSLTPFAEKQAMLRQCILDHNETQKDLSSLVAGLTQLQMNLDILEQERHYKGDVYEDSGKSIISPQELNTIKEIEGIEHTKEELMIKLQDLRSILQSQKAVVWVSKKECEQAFNSYCLETYGQSPDLHDLPLSTLDHAMASTAEQTLGFPKLESTDAETYMTSDELATQREEAISKHFQELIRVAQKQVDTLLEAYPKRPAWSTYY